MNESVQRRAYASDSLIILKNFPFRPSVCLLHENLMEKTARSARSIEVFVILIIVSVSKIRQIGSGTFQRRKQHKLCRGETTEGEMWRNKINTFMLSAVKVWHRQQAGELRVCVCVCVCVCMWCGCLYIWCVCVSLKVEQLHHHQTMKTHLSQRLKWQNSV